MITLNREDSLNGYIDSTDEADFKAIKRIVKDFAIEDPKLKWTPAVRAGHSDGKVYFIHKKNLTFQLGLTPLIEQKLIEHGYKYENNIERIEYSHTPASQLAEELLLPFTPYEFQLDGVDYILGNEKGIVQSATGSGKSLIIYMAIEAIIDDADAKVLLLVPDIGLVNQMKSDILSYAEDMDETDLHCIYGGKEKDADKQIIISTWQSIYDMKADSTLFQSVTDILVDEVHMAQAGSYQKLFNKMNNVRRRFGLTGTMPKDLIEKLKLIGTFSEVKQIVTARELIDMGLATETFVQPIFLKYTEEQRVLSLPNPNEETTKYLKEMAFIKEHKERMSVIIKHVIKTARHDNGNSIVLFRNVAYGKKLYQIIKKNHEHTFFVSGEVDGETREEIRKNMSKYTDAILVGTSKIMEKGINIPSLRYSHIVQNTKAETGIIQGLGRLMRLADDKEASICFDYVDDLRYTTRPSKKNPNGRMQNNYTMNWYLDRLDSYEEYEFNVRNPITAVFKEIF